MNQSYLPGETIYVGARIINNSWKDVLFSKISIIQVSYLSSVKYLFTQIIINNFL